MKITCIADLHGSFPKLESGDLLIVAGDCTTNDSIKAWGDFFIWFGRQKFRQKILIGGNHDGFLQQCIPSEEARAIVGMGGDDFEYLFDNGFEFEGLKIWGSPWSLTFEGINPHCTAFTGTEEEIAKKFELIPNDIDLLITHSPPYGMLDEIEDRPRRPSIRAGSISLAKKVKEVKPKWHVFGHIHEGYGVDWEETGEDTTIIYLNCSQMNADYEPVNDPYTITYEAKACK